MAPKKTVLSRSLLFLVALTLTLCTPTCEGSSTANSFMAFREVTIDTITAVSPATGSGFAFASSGPNGTQLHFFDSSTMTVDTIRLEEVTPTPAPSLRIMATPDTTVTALSAFDGSLAVASLSSGRVFVFDDTLQIHSVFLVVDSNQKTVSCDVMAFADGTLTCFDAATVVSVSIKQHSELRYLDQFFTQTDADDADSGTPGKVLNDLTVSAKDEYTLSYKGETLGGLPSVSLVGGYFYVAAQFADGSEYSWVVFRIDADDFSKTESMDMGFLSSIIEIRGILGFGSEGNHFVLSGIVSSSSDSIVISNFQIDEDEDKDDAPLQRSRLMFADSTGFQEDTKLQLFSDFTGNAVLTNLNYVHQFDAYSGVHENWVNQMISNNCAAYDVAFTVPVGDEQSQTYWGIGIVNTPDATGISQSSFLQVVKMNDEGHIDSSSSSNNFYSTPVNDYFTDIPTALSWDSGDHLKKSSDSPEADSTTDFPFDIMDSYTATSSVHSATTIKEFLPMTTLANVKDEKVSFSDAFSSDVSDLDLALGGPSWLKKTSKSTFSGSPSGTPDSSYSANLYGLSKSEGVLSCATLPIMVEATANNDGHGLFQINLKSQQTQAKDTLVRGTTNGDFFLWATSSGSNSNYILSRMSSSGEVNWQAEVQALEDGTEFKGQSSYVSAGFEYSQYAMILSDDFFGFFDGPARIWVQSVGDKMTLESLASTGQAIVAFGSQSYASFSLQGEMMANEELIIDGFDSYSFGEASLTTDNMIQVLIYTSKEFAIVTLDSDLNISHVYSFNTNYDSPSLVQSVSDSTVLVSATSDDKMVLFQYDFTSGDISKGVETGISSDDVNSVAISGDTLILVTDDKLYILDTSAVTGTVSSFTIAQGSCDLYDSASTEAGFIVVMNCKADHSSADNLLSFMTLSTSGKLSTTSPVGNILTQSDQTTASGISTLSGLSSSKISKTSTKDGNASLTRERGKTIMSGVGSTTTFTDNLFPFNAPTDPQSGKEKVTVKDEFVEELTVDQFGSNLGTCNFDEDASSVPHGFTLTIVKGNQSASLSFEADTHISNNSKVTGKAALVCNNLFEAQYVLDVVVNNPNSPEAASSLFSMVNFCLVFGLTAVFMW